MLTVKCAECSKPCMVYAARKMSVNEKENICIFMRSALIICDTILSEFKSANLNAKKLDVWTSCSYVQMQTMQGSKKNK